jgi:hypothetical protein
MYQCVDIKRLLSHEELFFLFLVLISFSAHILVYLKYLFEKFQIRILFIDSSQFFVVNY